MARLPDHAVRSIVKGVGAFMRQTPANELPRSLRPLRNFTSKALAGRSDQVLEALQDESLRARILDWLEDKPALPRADARVLETAARREDGWESEFGRGATASPQKRAESADNSRAKIREYKKRATAAQAELRSLRRTARTDAERARREREEIATESAELRTEIRNLRKELSAAQRRLKSAEERAEREQRRVRKQADKADAQTAALRARFKDLKSENAELKRRLSRAETKKPTGSPRRGSRRAEPDPPARRRRLVVPKGRFADARETLEQWLSVTDVELVVDGYNVTKHEQGFGNVSLEDQRDRLISESQRLSARFPKVSILVVFDGNEVTPGTARRKKGRVKIEYSRPDEIADDHIVARVEGLPPVPVVVVTSDRELQDRVVALDATVASSPQFLEVLRKA